jgi:hypothetical protein
MLGDCTAAFSRGAPEDPMTESTPPGRTADDSMTEKEKTDMVDQIEEFEGPDRREDRGDNEPPTPQDPGVASS